MPETMLEEPRRVELYKKGKLTQFQSIFVPTWDDYFQLYSIISAGSEIDLFSAFHTFVAYTDISFSFGKIEFPKRAIDNTDWDCNALSSLISPRGRETHVLINANTITEYFSHMVNVPIDTSEAPEF